MVKLQVFLNSAHFPNTIIKGALSSIPRWRYIREMEKAPIAGGDGDESDEEFTYVSCPKELRGVARGQKGFLQSCRQMFKGENDLVEHILQTEPEADFQRMTIVRSIMASAVYLAEKNLKYTTRHYLYTAQRPQYRHDSSVLPILRPTSCAVAAYGEFSAVK